MSGWDLGVYAATTLLIIAPLGIFIFHLREIIRRLKEDDWGQPPPS
ncbi:MAG: hypothetical protein GX878_05090 [Firmicutes bacterium]|nr:hypothetical protein [Bacillota bacterium]